MFFTIWTFLFCFAVESENQDNFSGRQRRTTLVVENEEILIVENEEILVVENEEILVVEEESIFVVEDEEILLVEDEEMVVVEDGEFVFDFFWRREIRPAGRKFSVRPKIFRPAVWKISVRPKIFRPSENFPPARPKKLSWFSLQLILYGGYKIETAIYLESLLLCGRARGPCPQGPQYPRLIGLKYRGWK